MYKCFCDICNKEFESTDKIERYKIKKRWSSWYESGWENLEVHEECWKELESLIASNKQK